jgi:hypothetical protein
MDIKKKIEEIGVFKFFGLQIDSKVKMKNRHQIYYPSGANVVRQTEIHTTEPLVPEPSPFEVEKELKRHESQGIDEIPAELFKAGCRTFHFERHKLSLE